VAGEDHLDHQVFSCAVANTGIVQALYIWSFFILKTVKTSVPELAVLVVSSLVCDQFISVVFVIIILEFKLFLLCISLVDLKTETISHLFSFCLHFVVLGQLLSFNTLFPKGSSFPSSCYVLNGVLFTDIFLNFTLLFTLVDLSFPQYSMLSLSSVLVAFPAFLWGITLSILFSTLFHVGGLT